MAIVSTSDLKHGVDRFVPPLPLLVLCFIVVVFNNVTAERKAVILKMAEFGEGGGG